jgi:hypothetical protein
MAIPARTLRPWVLSISFGFCGWLIGSSITTNSSAPERFCSNPSPSNSSPNFTTTSPRDDLFIAADTKGNITLHVENQPVSWVLEQIQRQSGQKLIQANDLPRSAASIEPASCSPQRGDEEGLLAQFQKGDESERYNNLMQAHGEKIRLPEKILKTLYETDQSPQVRMLAYAYAIEGFSGDPITQRSILENARSLPDSVIAQDAEQRLAAFTRLEFEREKIRPHTATTSP